VDSERELVALKAVRDEEAILDQLRSLFINFAVSPQNRDAGVDRGEREMNRCFLDRAVCDALILRLGNRIVEECDSVLVSGPSED